MDPNQSEKPDSQPHWKSWLGRIIIHGIELGAIALGLFWLGRLDHRVDANGEKISELSTDAESKIKDLKTDVKGEIRDLESRVSNGGLITRSYRGEKTDLHRRRQIQFMTPSVETWAAKEKTYASGDENPNVKLDSLLWQKVDGEKIENFGREIITQGFTKGWRRYPYEGQGRYRDVGWWWVATVDEGFKVEKFVEFYRTYWGTQEMYIEEFDAHGDVMPNAIIPHPQLPAVVPSPKTGPPANKK